ncbi:diacylglycerol kinase [Paraburkholderia fungorum]|uniref:diacylglycerol kinase n=1 Tax=Paraburkholderia fungorum TaxID=134537 RepID=UPI0038BB9B1A
MRTRNSTAAHASNGALRAVDAGTDSAGIEPFDDVRKHDTEHDTEHDTGHAAPNHANHANGLRGMNGASIERSDSPDSDVHHEPLSPDDPLAPLPFNPYKGNRGLTRAWHAMKNSLAGFRVAIREESAFRQELTLAAILIPCGVLVPVDPVSRVLLLGSVLLVLIVELLNSSVEAAIDRISLERHELSRRAKDLGSAAVMVALGMCLMTWGLIVGPLVVRWVKAWL